MDTRWGIGGLALIAFVLILSFPGLAVSLLFLVTPVVNPSIRLASVRLYLNDLSVCLLLASLAVDLFRRPNSGFRLVKHDIPVLLFAIMVLASLAFIASDAKAVKRALALALFIAGYFCSRLLCRDRKGVHSLANLLALGAVLASVTGLYTCFAGNFRGESGVAFGAFGNPNGLANYLLLTAPFLFVVFASHPRGAVRLGALVGLASAFVTMLLTDSRGGTIGMAALAIVFLVAVGKRTAYPVITAAILCSCAWLHITMMEERDSQLLDLARHVAGASEIIQRDRFYLWVSPGVPVVYDTVSWSDIDSDKNVPTSFLARMVLWGQAWDAFRSSPLVGIGIGQADFSAIPYDSKNFDGAFNIWLTVLAEMGIAGLLALCCMMWRFGRLIVSTMKTAIDRHDLLIASALASAYVGYLLHSSVEDMLYAVMTNWLFGVILGLIASLSLHSRTSRIPPAPSPGMAAESRPL